MSLPLTKGGGGYFYLSMPWRIQPNRKLKSRWIFCGISRVVFMKVSRRSLRLQVSRQKLAARIFHSAEYKLWVQDFKFVNSKFKNRRKNPIFILTFLWWKSKSDTLKWIKKLVNSRDKQRITAHYSKTAKKTWLDYRTSGTLRYSWSEICQGNSYILVRERLRGWIIGGGHNHHKFRGALPPSPHNPALSSHTHPWQVV